MEFRRGVVVQGSHRSRCDMSESVSRWRDVLIARHEHMNVRILKAGGYAANSVLHLSESPVQQYSIRSSSTIPNSSTMPDTLKFNKLHGSRVLIVGGRSLLPSLTPSSVQNLSATVTSTMDVDVADISSSS